MSVWCREFACGCRVTIDMSLPIVPLSNCEKHGVEVVAMGRLESHHEGAEHIAALESKVDEWIEREALACPEGQTFEETLAAIRGKRGFIVFILRRGSSEDGMGWGEYVGWTMDPDHARKVLIEGDASPYSTNCVTGYVRDTQYHMTRESDLDDALRKEGKR